MRIAPRFRLSRRASEDQAPPRQHIIQLLLIVLLLATSFPAGVGAQSTNAVSAYGCIIDPSKPAQPGNNVVAKAQIQCPSALTGRAIRTELQQRRADGVYYTVAKSILIRDVPGVLTGQWYGAGSDQVNCKKVSGTRKFKSIIMITDGQGNVTQTASNPEDFNRDCVNAGDPPLVGLVFGSNSIDDCAVTTEVLTDPNAEFTDFDDPASESNPEPCEGGVVTSLVTPQPDADWVLTVAGVEDGLPTPRAGGYPNAQLARIIPLGTNDSQNAAAILAQEEAIQSLFEPGDSEEPATLEVNAAQSEGPCQRGDPNERRIRTFSYKNKEFGNIKIKSRVYYKRVSCPVWQITDVRTALVSGNRTVRLESNSYEFARLLDRPTGPFVKEFYHYEGCPIIRFNAAIRVGQLGKWDFLPGHLFGQAAQNSSDQYIDPNCAYAGGIHTTGSVWLTGPRA